MGSETDNVFVGETVIFAVLLQPRLSVTVTIKLVAEEGITVIFWVPPPLFHLKE